jgi:hypothetical protein
MKKLININELNHIIAKHFGRKFCNTIDADIGTINEQFTPKHFTLGGGAVLSIRFELSEDKEVV